MHFETVRFLLNEFTVFILIADSYTTEDIFYSWYESVGKLRKTKGVEWIASEGNVFTLVDVSSVQKEISNNSKGKKCISATYPL